MGKESPNTTPSSDDRLDEVEILELKLNKARIPRKYIHSTWGNFDFDSDRLLESEAGTKLVQRLERFEDWRGDEPDGTLVFLTGRPGCGKTHLACATIHRWVMARRPGALFVVVGELLTELRRGFDKGTSYGDMRQARDAKLLVLDDLGSEMATEWVRDTMYMMINYRLNHMKPTIVTSNLRLGEIAETYHSRLASRLAGEIAIDMNLLGDHRLVKP